LTNFLKPDRFNNGGICSLSSTASSLEKDFLEKRKLPEQLVVAIINARKASEAQKEFQKEFDGYLDKCKRGRLTPKTQWLKMLQWLAQGKDMASILDALQIHPREERFLKFLESLKAHGFPDYFLNKLISEIPSDSLSNEAKDNLRKWLRLNLPRRKIQ